MIAYNVCCEVLFQLGEDIPETLCSNQMTLMIEATIGMVKDISDKDLLGMKEMDSKLATLMRFYRMIYNAAYFAKSEMLPFLACQMVQHTMENGMCKHSISSFLLLATILCGNTLPKKDIDTSTKVGKAAMSCLTQRYNTSEQISETYGTYYGFLAWRTEPLQTCTKKLGQGFDVGMSIGEPDTAFTNSVHQIRSLILAGDRLQLLMEKVDYYFQLADAYNNSLGKMFFSIFRSTITILINGGDSSQCPMDILSETAIQKFSETMHFHMALRSFWQGYHSRSQYFNDKMTKGEMGELNATYITFINGLNSLELMKTNYTNMLRAVAMRAIKVIKEASVHSSWNFKNKVSNKHHLMMLKFYQNISKINLVFCHTLFSTNCWKQN
jgi:hypothetical protein